MTNRITPAFRAALSRPIPHRNILINIAWFRHLVELNKTRHRRDGDPPAALPVPATRPGGGGLSGGAAVALEFDND